MQDLYLNPGGEGTQKSLHTAQTWKTSIFPNSPNLGLLDLRAWLSVRVLAKHE